MPRRYGPQKGQTDKYGRSKQPWKKYSEPKLTKEQIRKISKEIMSK